LEQSQSAAGRFQSFVLGHWALAMRSCLVTVVLVGVVLPASGLGLAAWLALVPTASEAESANAYRAAPVCSSSAVADCLTVEEAMVVDVFATQGRWGSYTDTFRLKLADGVHLTNIYFDIFAPQVAFAPIGGDVRVHEFRGRVTTVYAADGKAYETGDSPIGGSSWRGGAMAALIVVCAPILVVALVLVRAFGLKSIYRLLRHPNKPLPTYADYMTAKDW
jgi:hypothetical protein